jgi:hypothetical protein
VKDRNLLKVEITFFLSGALVGILFVWLVSVATTVDFWFIRGNQFVIPKVNYWLVFGALLASGLAFSYCICVLRGWLMAFGHWAESRRILATLFFLIAFPSGHIIGSRFLEFLSPMFAYFLACLLVVSLISVALWLFTSTWKTWLAIFMLLAIPVAYILTIGVYESLDLSNHAYDILRMGSLGGLLSGISGYWLATPRIYSAKVQVT